MRGICLFLCHPNFVLLFYTTVKASKLHTRADTKKLGVYQHFCSDDIDGKKFCYDRGEHIFGHFGLFLSA